MQEFLRALRIKANLPRSHAGYRAWAAKNEESLTRELESTSPALGKFFSIGLRAMRCAMTAHEWRRGDQVELPFY